MLSKLALPIFIVVGLVSSNCSAQTVPSYQPNWNSSSTIPVSPASFKTYQDDDEAEDGEDADAALITLTDKLSKQVERLELRIRELEDDVENKLDEPEDSEEQSETLEEFEERFESIEEDLEDQEKAIDKVSGSLPGLLFHSHKTPKMQFYGRIHLDYWAFPKVDQTIFPLEGGNPQDRVTFRRVRIGIKGDLNDNMFYKYEGEFAGGEDPSYRDVFIGFKHVPILQTVIIGNHKRPYGLDHLNSSRHNVFIERPFVVEALNQDSRRLGVSANGITEDLGWNWRYGVWNQQLTQTGAGWVDDDYQLEIAGRLARTAWYDESSGGRGYAHLAIAGSMGVVDGGVGSENNQARYRTRPEARSSGRWLDTGRIAGADETAILGLESALNLGAFHINGEYMRAGVDRIAAVGPDVEFDGGYVQASYLWTGEHHPWNRKTGTLDRLKPFENFFLARGRDDQTLSGWGAWETALRYSWANFNDSDVNGGDGTAWTLGVNWYWNAYARMQFNYINGEIESGPGGFGDYEIFGARIMVDF